MQPQPSEVAWHCVTGTITGAGGSTIVSGGGAGGSAGPAPMPPPKAGLFSKLSGAAAARRSSALKAQLQRVSCGLGSDSGSSIFTDSSIHAANMVYRMTGTTGSLAYMAPEVCFSISRHFVRLGQALFHEPCTSGGTEFEYNSWTTKPSSNLGHGHCFSGKWPERTVPCDRWLQPLMACRRLWLQPCSGLCLCLTLLRRHLITSCVLLCRFSGEVGTLPAASQSIRLLASPCCARPAKAAVPPLA